MVLMVLTVSANASSVFSKADSKRALETLTSTYQVELDGVVLDEFGTGTLFNINFLMKLTGPPDDDTDDDGLTDDDKFGRTKYGNIVLKSSLGLDTEEFFEDVLEHHAAIEKIEISVETVDRKIPVHNDDEWIAAIDILSTLGGGDCDDREDDCAATLTLAPVNNVSVVPVPAAVWLFASGLIGLVGVSRRKA